MKTFLQLAFASLLLAAAAVIPVTAYAIDGQSGHNHSAAYHDRTPRVHIHGSHPHRG
jgi:predicted secreted Zn-dependent protease